MVGYSVDIIRHKIKLVLDVAVTSKDGQAANDNDDDDETC